MSPQEKSERIKKIAENIINSVDAQINEFVSNGMIPDEAVNTSVSLYMSGCKSFLAYIEEMVHKQNAMIIESDEPKRGKDALSN